MRVDEAEEGRNSCLWLPHTCPGDMVVRMRTVMALSLCLEILTADFEITGIKNVNFISNMANLPVIPSFQLLRIQPATAGNNRILSVQVGSK